MDSDHGDRLHHLFTLLTRGELDAFLQGCTDDVSLTARGTGTRTTIVRREEIPDWFASMHALTDGTLGSSICLVLSVGHENIVILRHTFERDGVIRSYETVNFCTFRQQQLMAWFSHPLDIGTYAEAWGTTPVPQPA
jgi:ketosteroid isomerase-like protein